MTYKAQFQGWQELTISDLLVAYRKAKSDCFFDKGFPTALKFAEYEQELLTNLNKLLKQLQNENGFLTDSNLSGTCQLIPKKLGLNIKKDFPNGHTHFSDPNRAFKHLRESNDLEPEFRIVGDFPVDTHIISALWINMIGHKFDSCLNNNLVYGSRLRRINGDNDNDNEFNRKKIKSYHITAMGSFRPYFHDYQKWRDDGLKAIRTELECKRPVIAVSLDLKSYYHLLDPSFIAFESFQKEIGLKLDKSENNFTLHLSTLLSAWSKKASEFIQHENKNKPVNGGLVIGLSASRIISNVLLQKWDRLVCERLTPIHYGRYVDDMFLVFHDPFYDSRSNVIYDTKSLMLFLQRRLGVNKSKNRILKENKNTEIWEINLGKDYQKKSKIQLQANKQKLFILDGQAGCDLLDSIEKEIRDLSSEHRLMPEPDQLEHTTAARVLAAEGAIGEEAVTLRHADGLTIRRLSWSLQLRHVETLAHDLPSKNWMAQRKEFYDFAYNHILRADKIFAQYQYLPRLLSFAVNLKDWIEAETIVRKSFSAFDLLCGFSETQIMNGSNCKFDSDIIFKKAKECLALAFIDAIERSYPIDLLKINSPSKELLRITKLLCKYENKPITIESLHKNAVLLAETDLAKTPYKKLLENSFSRRTHENDNLIFDTFKSSNLLNYNDLTKFLTKMKKQHFYDGSIVPFLLPTRPYNPEEIAELLPECVNNLASWIKYVQILRGVSIRQISKNNVFDSNKVSENALPTKIIGNQKSKYITIAISNLATSDESFYASASNKPNLSIERYQKLASLVNQTIQLKPRPNYLLLPELSLPIEWIDSISNRLQYCGINLIAGTEYRHLINNEIYSEAFLMLSDDRLGYPSFVRIRQSKLLPAVGEDYELTSKFGKHWTDFSARKENGKYVYIHNDFCFGIMVCSELQNSKTRISFQGEVDALLVLAWNKDLDTFSALVESAALDVHAYVVLVNNRNYGDSRVRTPAKESFQRDLARLRGGENDFCVTVKLDVEKLRAFQSREKRWVEPDDPFKPTPEGFKMSKNRELLPPK